MKNEKEIIICVGLGVMVVDTAEDAAAVEIMDGAGIAVEITEEIPIGEVSMMVMQSATGMAMMPEETASLAAAAAMQKEYTLPDVTQTVILTRMEGRTPVPERERLEELAKHRATMIIFLSVGRIAELAERLRTAYPAATPVAVVYKASWPEEKIVTGTLLDIAEKVQAAGITKTALVTVGEFLGDTYALSKLYDKTFTHEFRKGTEA